MIKKDNYVTPTGYQRYIRERDHLLKIERPEITKTVAWAASLGDRSENADYQYGKRRLREIDRRVRFLNTRINTAMVVNPLEIKSTRIQFGCSIDVLGEDGAKRKFTIVGVDEINPQQGLISWKSPIGSKLLGKEIGDEITISTPSGDKEYEILHLEYVDIDFGEVEELESGDENNL